jgi:carbamoyltransferase
VIINTSFNIRGEPIVCTPQDAYRCFMGCDMDVLVLENFILYKTEQPQLNREEKEKYVASFHLD